tara:strand:- start:120 stop:425 length:306 start_codon:yes stop_codon:yes gene_type:complete
MIKAKVTKKWINIGHAHNNRECPIANCFNRGKGVKGVSHATIYDTHSTLFLKKKINGKTPVLDFKHSDQIKNFIEKFDKGEAVDPQEIIFNKKNLERKRLV